MKYSKEPCAFDPVAVEGLSDVKKLVIDGNSVIALKQDGTVWGWGQNRNGELCDGTTENRNRPVQGIANAVDIAMSNNPTIVLGNGTVWTCNSKLKQIPRITSAVAVRQANQTTIVRLKDGTLRGWGSGIFGALGNGHVEGYFPEPSPPSGLGPVLDHYWASNSAYAIKADGTVMAWAFYTGGAGEDKKQWQLTPVAWRKVRLAEMTER